MLRILFSGPTLERSRLQAGLVAGHTIEGSDWIKTTTGKEKITLQLREEREKKHNHVFTESIWSGPLEMVVSKLYFVLRCTASGTWWCVPLASLGCRVIFVSAECHCSPLNILESCGVAVRSRERHGGGSVSHDEEEMAGKHMFCC